MMDKYDYVLKRRVERLVKNQGDRIYQIVTSNGSKMELCFYCNSKDVRNSYPNCKILRSHKMTDKEMLSYAGTVYNRMARRLQYVK